MIYFRIAPILNNGRYIEFVSLNKLIVLANFYFSLHGIEF